MVLRRPFRERKMIFAVSLLVLGQIISHSFRNGKNGKVWTCSTDEMQSKCPPACHPAHPSHWMKAGPPTITGIHETSLSNDRVNQSSPLVRGLEASMHIVTTIAATKLQPRHTAQEDIPRANKIKPMSTHWKAIFQ